MSWQQSLIFNIYSPAFLLLDLKSTSWPEPICLWVKFVTASAYCWGEKGKGFLYCDQAFTMLTLNSSEAWLWKGISFFWSLLFLVCAIGIAADSGPCTYMRVCWERQEKLAKNLDVEPVLKLSSIMKLLVTIFLKESCCSEKIEKWIF